MIIVYTRSSTIFDDSRATKEILAFIEEGYSVKVFGWDRSGEAYQRCKQLFSSYTKQVSFNFYSGKTGDNKIQKIIERKRWSDWLENSLSEVKDIDVIHACDYDTGNAVNKYAKKHSVRYVYDIFDYYVDAHPVPGFLRRIIEKDEIRIINEADVTIICTEERKEQIKQAKPKKLIVVHNSPEVSDFEECSEEYDYAYCGSMYHGRLIEEVLDDYPKHSHLKVAYAGYGEFAEKAASLDKMYDNFTYFGPIPYSKVLEIENRSKVLSAIYIPTIRNHQLCAPNKFYEAMALGKPIIVCRGTGIDKVVEREKSGVLIDYDAEEFYHALEDLLSNNRKRESMGKNGKDLFMQKYDWKIMKKRLIEVYRILKGDQL